MRRARGNLRRVSLRACGALAVLWLCYTAYLDVAYGMFPRVTVGGLKLLLAATAAVVVAVAAARAAAYALAIARRIALRPLKRTGAAGAPSAD